MSDRRYTKQDPIADDIADASEELTESQSVEEVPTQILATRYSKAENVLQPKAFVVVFSNGEVREKKYFQAIKNHCVNLQLEFFANPVSPDDMMDGVLDKKKEYEMTSGRKIPDKYYLVTDVDHFYNDIVKCRPNYKRKGVMMIISNPCFEVWLYYSKRDDPFEGFVKPENLLKISQEVKRFLNEKIPGGCDPRKAFLDIRKNIQNARKNYGEDEKGLPIVFATNMFLFAEDVLPYVE